MKNILITLVFLLLSGCEDQYQKGYTAGYAIGVSITQNKLNEVIETQAEKIKALERPSRPSLSGYSTEVCGGGGVHANGIHHSAGKTGCVRVFSDGRVEKY